jgi:Spy/CpxP family protein refolding chaperone
MKRISTLLTIVALTACCAPAFSAAAETVSHTSGKPKSAQGHKVPMRHDQLTLYPHGRPARPQKSV